MARLGLSSGAQGVVLCCMQQIQDGNEVLKLLICEELKLERQREKPKINPGMLKHTFGCPWSVGDGCDCPSSSYSGGRTQLALTAQHLCWWHQVTNNFPTGQVTTGSHLSLS